MRPCEGRSSEPCEDPPTAGLVRKRTPPGLLSTPAQAESMAVMTPWVRRLIIANVLMFLISFPPGTGVLPTLFREFALYPGLLLQRPWTGFTYMFLHGSLGHIFFNMIALFFFGPRLERRLGGADFIKLYMLAGFGGAAFSFFFGPGNPVVGASGAVYGVLLGFAMIWPHERIYIWAILPMPAWLLAVIMVVFSLGAGFGGAAGNTAHFAHLGGLAVGFVYLKWIERRKGAAQRDFRSKLQATPSDSATRFGGLGGIGGLGGGGGVGLGGGGRDAMKRWEAIDLSRLHEINRAEVELLVSKARLLGVAGLSLSERQFLDRMVESTRG